MFVKRDLLVTLIFRRRGGLPARVRGAVAGGGLEGESCWVFVRGSQSEGSEEAFVCDGVVRTEFNVEVGRGGNDFTRYLKMQ